MLHLLLPTPLLYTVAVHRYEDQPAVVSVAAKFKRLHAVSRKAGGLQVSMGTRPWRSLRPLRSHESLRTDTVMQLCCCNPQRDDAVHNVSTGAVRVAAATVVGGVVAKWCSHRPCLVFLCLLPLLAQQQAYVDLAPVPVPLSQQWDVVPFTVAVWECIHKKVYAACVMT